MAGGQKGLSFVGEPMVFAIVATFLVTILLQLQLGCLGDGDGGSMSEYDESCEQEYADANDGNPETEVETAILEQPDCMAYVANLKVQRQQGYVETVEGTTP